MKITLETSGEDITLETSGEHVKIALETSGEDYTSHTNFVTSIIYSGGEDVQSQPDKTHSKRVEKM